MKRPVLTFLLLVVVCAVAVGFYRGWFTLSSSNPNNGSNKVDVNLSVDRDKIQEDAETVKEKTKELTNKVRSPATAQAERESPNR